MKARGMYECPSCYEEGVEVVGVFRADVNLKPKGFFHAPWVRYKLCGEVHKARVWMGRTNERNKHDWHRIRYELRCPDCGFEWDEVE
jgi:uncharacterized Zn finger protein